ncbi:AmmeMemoRadiSam system radical SAM enzyme [Verrucomicrobiota bacterium]
MQTARFWEKTDKGQLSCQLCPHNCLLADGKTGLCGVRRAQDGELKAIGYGLLSSSAMDPIEKKPLYHFHPGSNIFSIGGWGCNFKCDFCQNWTISQQIIEQSDRYSPDEVVAKAAASDSIGIAYTYNEPLIAYEFVRDCARIARAKGLVNVLVTNGHINREPAAELLPLIDALNIDIKSMDSNFYREHCHGFLEPVLHFARQAVEAGCHVELTNLLIPGLNDNPDDIKSLAGWIGDNLDDGVPLHISAYRPQYKLKNPPTSMELLEQAYAICSKELSYVYIGNVIMGIGQDTLCSGCGEVLISRHGYSARVLAIDNGVCTACGAKVSGWFKPQKSG